jgi:hypothetical protein
VQTTRRRFAYGGDSGFWDLEGDLWMFWDLEATQNIALETRPADYFHLIA